MAAGPYGDIRITICEVCSIKEKQQYKNCLQVECRLVCMNRHRLQLALSQAE